ncbi:mRNA surveillance protein pelota [Candidatus Woesearchaeota archaeon CG_4_10_14_0_2_um_filter_33_13]|nr:MAG: mRNA surveillance protein pelota [Candidatus Woesearchaeota archaeon CG_4_10_14_0_2_um_filter_33_13]
MDIVQADFKKGFVKLRITDPEDLWYLSHLIDPGDFVKGKTTRKIKIGEGENAKVAKKVYVLKIEAETIDYSNEVLRVNGRIREGPEELPKDSFQAIPLEQNSEFILEKVQWLEYQKQKLEESAQKKYNYLLCIFDREEALFALTKSFGYEVLLQLKGDVPKKVKTVEVKQDFQQEIIKALDVYSGRYSPEAIILASPAFYKEDLFKKINQPDLKKKIILANCSDVSESSLFEILKKPELELTLKSSRTRKENKIVEELLSEISQNRLAAYGWNEVKNAIDAGAVSKLLVTDDYIQRRRASNEYTELDLYLKQIDTLKGEIHIISSEHESGRKLMGLGGIAAILRYKLEWH